MNFHDKVHELVKCFKETNEYKDYISLKNEIKEDETSYNMLKDFKEKQREHQIKYINGEEVSKEEQSSMHNLYSILVQNDKAKKLLESEMKIDVLLADMQKIMGEALKEIVEF